MTVYTEDTVARLVEAYTSAEDEAGRAAVVKDFAEDLDVSEASIRGKLVAEGVYVAKAKAAKGASDRVTKADLVGKIAEAMGVSVDSVASLEKATKSTLESLVKFVGQSVFLKYPQLAAFSR